MQDAMDEYKTQLRQVIEAIGRCTDATEREKLINLRADLTELLQLTQQTIDEEEDADPQTTDDASVTTNNPPQRSSPAAQSSSSSALRPPPQTDEDAEFMRFMQEIRQVDEQQASAATAAATEKPEPAHRSWAHIKDKLSAALGDKCSAPHTHAWGARAYHNAMICGLDDRTEYDTDAVLDERSVCVKVLFAHPTHREMVPCPHYLDGECRFAADECHFSHGELVPYGELREYRAPDYGRLQRRRRWPVLVKRPDRMWHRAVALGCDAERQTCRLRLDGGGRELDVDYADVLPMSACTEADDDTTSDEESDDDDHGDDHDEVNGAGRQRRKPNGDSDDEDGNGNDDEHNNTSMHRSALVERSLLTTAPDRPLGEWEKHTRGFGSRMLQKYGYVLGTGLGHDGGGIVVPISAQVLPAGRSLDHCMTLREQSNGDQNLFSVERRLRKQQMQQEQRNVKAYEREARRTSSAGDVFSFMNESVLGGASGSTKTSTTSERPDATKTKESYKEHSTKNLNVAGFQLGEDIRRKEQEMQKLEASMRRHAATTTMHSRMNAQLNEHRRELESLRRSESIVKREQMSRKDKNKLTVF